MSEKVFGFVGVLLVSLLSNTANLFSQVTLNWNNKIPVADGATYGNSRPRIVLTANNVPRVVIKANPIDNGNVYTVRSVYGGQTLSDTFRLNEPELVVTVLDAQGKHLFTSLVKDNDHL